MVMRVMGLWEEGGSEFESEVEDEGLDWCDFEVLKYCKKWLL